MDIVLSHETAFRFWRSFVGNLDAMRRAALPAGLQHEGAFPDTAERELAILGVAFDTEHPLDLLYAEQTRRARRGDIRAHACTVNLPAGSILRLSSHVCIVSPDLCFVQLGSSMPAGRLAMAGCELCSAYAHGFTGDLPKRPPITTAESLAAYAELVPGLHGRKLAQRMSRYVLDNAESPMEAKVALLLTLPQVLGGYGMPRPALNPELSMSRDARTLYDVETCRPDLYWADARVDVEYDGDVHEGQSARLRDTARRAALDTDGINVTVLSYQQVADAAAFDVVARSLAKRLRFRLRLHLDDFDVRQWRLRGELGLDAPSVGFVASEG